MNNKSLFLILIGLLLFTYFIEEKKWPQSLFGNIQREDLFNERVLGDLKELKFKRFSLISYPEGFSLKGEAKNIRLDQEKVTDFFKVFGNIKIRKEFAPGPHPEFVDEGFSMDFVFEHKVINITLGKKSPIDGAFYLLVNNQEKQTWYLVEDVGPEPGVYSMGDKNRDTKYQRIRTYLSLPEEFFYETRIFVQMGLGYNFGEKVSKIVIKNTNNRPYEIFPQKKTMIPAPIVPLKFNDARYDEFTKQLGELRLSQIYKVFDKKLLKDQIALWQIKTEQGFDFEIKLFQKYGSLSGNFVFSENLPYLVEVISTHASLFFTPWQHFIDRRITSISDFRDWGMHDEELKMEFPKKQLIPLKIPQSADFYITSLNSTPPRQESFKKFLSYFIREADRVSGSDKNLKSNVFNNLLFTLHLRGLQVHVAFDGNELIFYFPHYQLYFHFFEGENLSIGKDYLDYFGN